MTDKKDINALRYYVTRLEEDFVNADLEAERLRKHNSKLVLDIATLGQEVGRLREALEDIASGRYSGVLLTSFPPKDPAVERARAALAEKGEK